MESSDKNAEEDTDKPLNRAKAETDDSLSLSITPPIPEDTKKDIENSDESISEHLTSNNSDSTSVENDRSYPEIEVSNRPFALFSDLPSSDEEKQGLLQDQPPLLDASFCSDDNSIISLNYLDRIGMRNVEVSDNVRSILEEILNNDQFHSGSDGSFLMNNTKEESLNIFANLDLDDKSLTNFRNEDDSLNEKNLFGTNFEIPLVRGDSDIGKRLKDFEEMITIKDSTIAALTSELDSCRELSNTNSGSMISTTEYKQLQEECHNKLMEYNSAIVYKNDLIQQLSESLDQSVSERKELSKQIDFFKDEIVQLQKQLQDTTKMVTEHICKIETKEETDSMSPSVKKDQSLEMEKEATQEHEEGALPDLDVKYAKLKENLDPRELNLFNNLKIKINDFVQQSITNNTNLYEEEIKKLKEKILQEKDEYQCEINRLRDLLANIKCGSTEIMELKSELEAKHSTEMEELRTYFEKKCTDLEKNYSEEIFSQQSRRMSGSTCSEAELSSDLLYSHPPGPDGDIRNDLQPNITKKDVTNLKNELNSILNKINRYNLENITEDDFNSLKFEIGKCNLNNLLKYDLAVIRSDLQNKYHAELEVLREDNENKVDLLNVEHEKKLKNLENKYTEEIENLKYQLEETGRQNISTCSAVQEVGSSGEFEINEVIQSYERRLQEQVTLAKIDIITALENQIQRLASNEADDEEWPSELLQLRDKFTDKYENEIKQLKDQHQNEIEKLKDEHMKILNGALERARRRSLRDNESLNKGELEILKERDNLKKQVFSLRNLLGELLKYFTQCEDELNNTLVDELLKQGFDKNLTQIEEELSLNYSNVTNSSKTCDSLVTRVHLAPNFSDLINLIETNSQDDCDSKDISIDLKNELSVCLDKLKQEANAILMLTTNMPKAGPSNGSPKNNSLEEKLSSLTRQLITEAQVRENLKEELSDALSYIKTLERGKEDLEKQLEEVIIKGNMLENDLLAARSKIAELIENGHKEVVSEGYGEEGHSDVQRLGDTTAILVELQERARNMLAQSRTSADPTLLHLIEELCRVGERIKEESQRDHQDLKQQIDAADKKYRTTQTFLEEQAAERELERDEAQKNIDQLHEQLRERDRDRNNCERFSVEVEQLDQQLQDMTKLLSEESRKYKEVEAERNEAVEKIKVLRDIIRELELQAETKSKEIEDCLQAIQRLECIVDQQHRSINELRQNNSLKDFSDIHELRKHIENLENELQHTRLNSELAGSEGALKQIKTQLFEFEAALDKKTRELEVLHSTDTNCSSPSEDISARDLVRPKSPDMMEECEVPLQQLARLKEKLVRHSRAEDAAIKRIRDLEMQIFGLKNELEESCNEKEYLKKQIQEHLVLISDFQIRLTEQRIRADHIEKQTNTSLELKIYDLQNEITSLREKLQGKEKTINHQQTVLIETQERLKALENEISSEKEEDELLIMMQKELEMLRAEKAQLQAKMSQDSQIVPNLVENIISDKNVDIEKLRYKLQQVEKMLESYTSLNLSRQELSMLSNFKKSSGTSIEEILSILDISQAEHVRRADSRNEIHSLATPPQLIYKRNPNETVFLGNTSEPEMSSIEKVGPSNIHYTIEAPLSKPNSTEIHKSLEKRVHFEDTVDIVRLNDTITALNAELEDKNKAIDDYKHRLNQLINLEEKIEKLQLTLEETEKALALATETFESEQKELRDSEKNLRVELAAKKLQLSEQEKKIEMLEQDSARKDEMCLTLAREKKELEHSLNSLKHDFKYLDTVIKERDTAIEQLHLLMESGVSMGMESLKQELVERGRETISLQIEREYLCNKLDNLTDSSDELSEALTQKDKEIETITTEMNNFKQKVDKKINAIRQLEDVIQTHEKSLASLENEVKKQRDIIADRECEIEIANEDAKRYQNDLAVLEDRIKNLENSQHQKVIDQLKGDIKGKNNMIEELGKERTHLRELLTEKDKIINQITEDSNKLHVNLVTIQNKLKENGNILDLSNKLKEEQTRTAELVVEIHQLKAQLMQYETKKNTAMTSSVDEITDQLKRELDFSAQIDSNIITAVSDQSLSSISESQDIEVYKKVLAKEKSTRKELLEIQQLLNQQILELEEKCNTLELFNTELRNTLDRERMVLHETEAEDAMLIEQLRIQLDTVLDNEEGLQRALQEEKSARKKLEGDLEAMRKVIKSSSSGVSRTDSTEYKALPSNELMYNKLKKEFDILLDERSKLADEITSLQQGRSQMQNGYKYTQEMLNLELQNRQNLEDRVQNLIRNEKELREALLQNKVELEQRMREIESNRLAMDEMEQEKSQLRKQKQELVQRLKMQPVADPQTNTTTAVPDFFLGKIKQLNDALMDNKKMVDLIQRLSNENKKMENELQEINGWKATNLPFGDLVARSDYLFAKTLRLESTKKALIWQKRYLLDYLQGHQRHCLIEALPQGVHCQHEFRSPSHRSPKERFRSAAFVVVSIIRMKYLVRRWHSGVRIAERVNSRHYRKLSTYSEHAIPTQFQVGQPVSSQLFSNTVTNPYTAIGSRNPFNFNQEALQDDAAGYDVGRIISVSSDKDNVPWSGHTPPSKESMKPRRIQIGSHVLKREDMTPLKAPQLLAQFVERFDQIQEKLGVVLETNTT